jgi:chromosome segregation ATPase
MSQTLKIEELNTREHTLVQLDEKTVQRYVDDFDAGREVPPVSIDTERNVVDGCHRLAAAKRLGRKTIEVVPHIMTPLDLPGRKAIADGINRDAQQRTKNVKVVDRREAPTLRAELANLQHRGAAQETERAAAAQYVVTLTGRLVQLRKLKKQYEKVTETQPRNRALIEEVDTKITAGEQNLAQAKKNEERLTKIVASINTQIEEFQKASPGKNFPTNAEFLKEAADLQKMERELADYSVW